ncbi:MAG: hypothetical protein C0622_05615, partial [Desulfuromonas sp.]
MVEATEQARKLIVTNTAYLSSLKKFLSAPEAVSMANVIAETQAFKTFAQETKAEPFGLILERLEALLTRLSVSGGTPGSLVKVSVGLAVDQLEKLGQLLESGQQASGAMVEELLDAFALAERSTMNQRRAVEETQSVRELYPVADEDPFAEDGSPEEKVVPGVPAVDPFAEDCSPLDDVIEASASTTTAAVAPDS